MNARHIIKWPYYNPFFGEARIEADGNLGIAESALNIALWSAVVGVGAHLISPKHGWKFGVGVFAAFVAAEVLFNAAGNHSGNNHFQINPAGNGGGAPGTAAPSVDNPDYADATARGFSEVDQGGFGEQNDN